MKTYCRKYDEENFTYIEICPTVSGVIIGSSMEARISLHKLSRLHTFEAVHFCQDLVEGLLTFAAARWAVSRGASYTISYPANCAAINIPR